MSWYVTYYLGIMKDDNKIHPLGPFNADGELCSVHYTSRSFTTDLPKDFIPLSAAMLSDDFIKVLSNEEDENGNPQLNYYAGWLPFSKLPSGDYIKKGYFLRDTVMEYLKDKDSSCMMYEYLTPEEYAIKIDGELKFGKQSPKRDDEGYEIEAHYCSDYVWFAYPEYQCKEYEASLFRTVAEMIRPIPMPDGWQLVVVKEEG